MEKPSYQRILLKISGEGLAGEPGRGIDFAFVREVGQVIKACVAQGVQVGLVIGGGNFWRGAKDGGGNMERTRADQMGMLATVINSLAVQDVLEQIGQPARVLTSIPMGPVGQITSRAAAEEHFAAGRVVIFAGGTGNPYFSTDTAAVLRAAEIQADMILLAKNIDGVYSADPKKDPNAVKYDSITYDQVLADHLQVMDLTATSLALEHHIPVMIFALAAPQNIQRAVMGERDRHHCRGGEKMIKEMYQEYEHKMKKTVEVVISDFGGVRAGRANASVLDKISVEYYGTETPINQVASISAPDPRTLVIQPWDGTLLKAIEKALLISELGINPQNDGKVIRLVFPQLTEERRKELTKQVKKYGEGGKVAIRNIRRDAMEKFKAMKKKSEITEDDLKECEETMQKMTDKRCKEIDELTAKKEAELMAV